MSSAGVFVRELHSLEWIGILVARVAVGSLFLLSGRSKLFLRERREQMQQTLIEAHVPFPKFNAVFCFDGGICLRVIARAWRGDATGVCAAPGPDDCCHLDDSDSECQRNLSSGVARSISVSARGALPGDRYLAFLLRPWLA